MSQTTYRFKFNKDFLNTIREFSKIHSQDCGEDFLEAFQVWKRFNYEAIHKEEKRIVDLGFKGDIEEKIYKSARYYFKNKKSKPITETHTYLKTNYIPRNKAFFSLLETYIKNNSSVKPSILYKRFINETDSEISSGILNELTRLKNYQLDQNDSNKKIKKAFNNAYYKVKKKLTKQNNQ